MNKQTLIIDNVGFDVQAMHEMTEQQFVDLFLENDAIARHKTPEERKQYLQACYSSIAKVAAPDPDTGKPKKSSSGK